MQKRASGLIGTKGRSKIMFLAGVKRKKGEGPQEA